MPQVRETSTYGIITGSNIVHHLRVGVQGRVDKTDRALADFHTLAVDQTEKRSDSGSSAACAEDLAEHAIDDDAEPSTVGADVGIA